MDISCEVHFSFDQLIRPFDNGDMLSPTIVKKVESIPCGMFKRCVSGGGGDADEIDSFVMGSQKDGEGIIKSGITIEPNGLNSRHG